MVGLTIGYGSVLTALGIGGFVATGAEHKIALIPAGVGAAAMAGTSAAYRLAALPNLVRDR